MNKKVIHTVFEEVVKNNPLRIAIEAAGHKVTYSELNTQANRLSHLLNTENIVKEDIVATYCDDAFLQIVSLLGVFKSGGTYMAIDTKYKENHWSELYTRIQPSAIVITKNNFEDVKKYDALFEYSIPTVFVINTTPDYTLEVEVYKNDEGAYTKENRSESLLETNLHVDIDGDDANYIFFTSGSTGKPKSVLGNHKSLSHFIHWESKELGIGAEDRVGQLTSFSFDASLRDIFVPFINGGTLCIPSKEVKDDILQFSEWLSKEKITVLHTVPTVFRLIVSVLQDDQKRDRYSNLKYILLAGEKLYNRDIINWRTQYGNATTIINLYGATESTLVKSFYKVEGELNGTPSDILSVGQPISNTVLIVLNAKNELCKVNEVGDIYIKTPFLSKGYYKDQKQTDEKFIQNPLNTDRDIIYKTGDYGKYTSDRNVTVLGRKDAVVKLSGVRVDINAVESTILSIEEVDGIKCLVHQTDELNTVIVCFYSSKNEITSQVREHCRTYLSEYEIPSHFIYLDELPINANGKTDTIVLKDSIRDSLLAFSNYQKATNETEERLISIWEDVLQLDKVGINEDFLLLGGNSLKMILLNSRIHKEFGVSVSIQDLFTHRVLKTQATLIASSVASSVATINKVEKQDTYPLSPSQYRLWVLSQFEEASIAYNMPRYIELEAGYDVEMLKKSIEYVINRHESLRTVFIRDNQGEARQKIVGVDVLKFTIQYEDLSEIKDKNFAISQFILKDSKKPFDLENGPLFRASLLKLADDTLVFYYVIHHIIGDEWSLQVLGRDVLAYYNHYTQKEALTLPKIGIQYKDYTAWKLETLETETSINSKTYWNEKLSGNVPLVNLPSTKSRPKIKSYNGQALSTYVSPKVTQKLKEYNQKNGGSLFISLLTVWNIICFRYTQQRDIITGTPISGRDHIDLENQIGFYVNTLALRNEIQEGDNFDTLYNRVKEITLEAFNHQAYPFDMLVEDLDLNRDASRNALFDVMLILQNINKEEVTYDINEDALNEIVDRGACLSKFDIELNFQEVNDYLSFAVKYNADVYEKEMVENLMKHFKQLLYQIVGNTKIALDKIDYLTENEKHELLYEVNHTSVSYPQGETLVSSFKKQAQTNPDAIAIAFNEKRLTYRELDELSNQLTNYLLEKHGVLKDALVAISLEQSEWLMVAILGVLKSGAAYVPIDSEYPTSKIEYIKSDSNCKVLIDQKELDAFKTRYTKYSKNPISLEVESESLAYVIYTSGSTGNPKGVMIEHHSLMNYLNWATSHYFESNFNNKDFGLFTSLSFDLTVTSLFLPLINGGTLNVLDPTLDIPTTLTRYLESQVSGIKLTPAHISILESLDIDVSHQEVAIIGGDVLHKNHVDILRKRNPSIKIYNEYGPTESTVGCIVYEVVSSQEDILIGTPIANTEIYIINDACQLEPKGVVGEICISGKGLARGYFNREELNAEKFIDHPFKENEKLYKTGDLGRWLWNGNIEFLGRKDNQVKVNGHRIELGEVEYQLQLKESISEAVVLVNQTTNGAKELIAYLVATEEQNISDIRNYMLSKLPDYMVPSRYVQVASMPITVNGKIDKKSLVNCDGRELLSEATFQLPTNKEEETILAIWEEILGNDKISVKDNFFDLGGNSIKAIKILHKINQEFMTDINLRSLFNNPTIQNIAAQIIISRQQQVIMNTSKKLKEIQL